jgi:hypothetical protein
MEPSVKEILLVILGYLLIVFKVAVHKFLYQNQAKGIVKTQFANRGIFLSSLQRLNTSNNWRLFLKGFYFFFTHNPFSFRKDDIFIVHS